MREKISLVLSSDLLSLQAITALKGRKNLLAFSAGVDSTALFFLLLEQNITFDIAIIDYGIRTQSQEELLYAKSLAKRYNKTLYHDSIKLPKKNFEYHARQYRYQFFETIIEKEHYHNLITAHQLDDRLEWFLMQLTKGAGLVEMLGFEEIEERNGYQLIRPLLFSEKKALLSYLHTKKIDFFIDETNSDERYRRNYFRKYFSTPLLEKYATGIKKSFTYLAEDKAALYQQQNYYHDKSLYIIKNHTQVIRDIDKVCKKLGYLLSAAQKLEITKVSSLVIGGKIAISSYKEFIYIAPYVQVTMNKPFKEQCRILKIPPNIRPYLFLEKIDPTSLPRY